MLLLHGGDDVVARMDDVVQAALPGVPLVSIPGGTDFVAEEQPEAFANADAAARVHADLGREVAASASTPVTEAKVVPANTVYTATVKVSGGHGGSAQSLTGSLRVDLTRPAQQYDAPGTDPEELFHGGLAACSTARCAVAARHRHDRSDNDVTAWSPSGRPRTAGTRSPWCWTCPRRSARRPTWSAQWSWPTGCVPTRTPCGATPRWRSGSMATADLTRPAAVRHPRADPPASPAHGPGRGLGAVYLIWGSTYLGNRVALDSIPPLVATSARFLAAALLLFAVAALRQDAGLLLPRRRWTGWAPAGC